MNLFFWKKVEKEEKKPEGRRLVIPDDKVRHICELVDAYQKAPRGQDQTANYDCWAAIAEIFPEVKEGSWTLTFPRAITAEVVEKVDGI